MKRYIKSWLVILAVVLLLPGHHVYAWAGSLWVSGALTDSPQEIAERTKADADLYEVTLSEGKPILTELLQARMERYKKENNTDKAISDSVIIARILARDTEHRNSTEE